MSTIVALATGENLAAIAIIRLSGSDAHRLATQHFVPQRPHAMLPMRRALLGQITLAGEELDQVLLTLFAAPNSYTGEDMAEIACHGSPYIVQTLLQSLLQEGAQAAQPASEYSSNQCVSSSLSKRLNSVAPSIRSTVTISSGLK